MDYPEIQIHSSLTIWQYFLLWIVFIATKSGISGFTTQESRAIESRLFGIYAAYAPKKNVIEFIRFKNISEDAILESIVHETVHWAQFKELSEDEKSKVVSKYDSSSHNILERIAKEITDSMGNEAKTI